MSDLRLWLPGTAGDYASTPDSSAFDAITDDLCLVIEFRSWITPTAGAYIVGQYGNSGSRGWLLYYSQVDASLKLYTSSNGTAEVVCEWADFEAYITDGAWLMVRAADTLNGGSGIGSTWSTSTDGETWTERHTTSSSSSATINNSSLACRIGANGSTGGNNFKQQIGVVRIYRDGDDTTGTLVADFDPARDAALGDSTVTSSTTGEVWTLNGDALLIGAPASEPAVVDRPLYVDLAGVAADYVSTPDSATLDAIAADLTAVFHFPDGIDWTAQNLYPTFVQHDAASPSRGWNIYYDRTLDRIYLSGSTDGSTATGVNLLSNVSTTLTGDDLWLKIESAIVAGARSTTIQQRTTDGTWSTLNTAAGGPTSLYATTGLARIGGSYAAHINNALKGKVGRVLVYAGDDTTGALIVDFAPERDAYLGAESFTSSNTGEVWTLAGTAELRSAGGRIDWANADDEGLELPSRDVISGLTAPARRHNIATTPQRAGGYLVQSPLPNPRTVTVPVILRPAAPYTRARLDELRQRFAGVLHHPQLGRLIVADQNSDLRELRCFLANGLTGAEAMPAHEFDTLQFVAPDPYFYDLDDDTASIVSGTNTLTVAGDTDTPPIFTITGGASSNITSVTLERVDTGETLALTLTSALTTGVGLVIDHAAGTVLRAGSDIFSDLTSPTFFDLASGASSQVALTLGGTAGSYTGSVTYRPRWLTAYPAAS